MASPISSVASGRRAERPRQPAKLRDPGSQGRDSNVRCARLERQIRIPSRRCGQSCRAATFVFELQGHPAEFATSSRAIRRQDDDIGKESHALSQCNGRSRPRTWTALRGFERWRDPQRVRQGQRVRQAMPGCERGATRKTREFTLFTAEHIGMGRGYGSPSRGVTAPPPVAATRWQLARSCPTRGRGASSRRE